MTEVSERATATTVRFTVLRGGAGVLVDGEPAALGGAQQRRLLAALLAERGTVVSADRLADTIWPDGSAPDGARRTVMTYVSRLRTALGGDYIVTREHGYQLAVDETTYDAAEFEARLAVARTASGVDAVAAYDAALGLWSGRAFGDDGSEWWLRPVAARLEELRLVAHEERAQQLIEIGRHAEAIADMRGLIADQPLREQFVALEMRALYLAGRQAEALRAYREFATYLADETGLDPSGSLVDLEHRIMIGDSSLAPSTTVAVPGYELGELIGEGAFGAVYRAVQPTVGREVAVKAIRAELADDPRFVQRFEAEAQLVARLEHPHVVPLYDFWRQPGAAFLVFRLLRGGSLADRVAQGALPPAEVSRLVEEIGGALAAAHSMGIVHRDVKPANVLFDESGNSYLADFGIALSSRDDGDVDELTLQSAGSPLYASPEQARDRTASPASDQYSLAVVAWEALTGCAPFPGATATEVLRHKLAASLPTLGGPDVVPAGLDAVLRRASAPMPIDRYPDIGAFVRAWASACAGSDLVRTTGGAFADQSQRRVAGTLAAMDLGSVNPYKGLRAFREADAAEFSGRTALVDSLVERVTVDPFVVVVGPSGSGKSSVVHAGVVPQLRDRGALVVSMVPGSDPFMELEAALRRVATADIGDLRQRLLGPEGLVKIATDIVRADSSLVLVIDQFEELWTLVGSDSVRDRFATCIADAISSHDHVHVVATLRADLYDRPLQHPVLGPMVSAATFAVTPMSAPELQEAITLPAERVGVRFEPGLVAIMVGDVVSRPGTLPLLQFTLTELFEQRRNGVVSADAYAELGGIGGAIARRAEQLYDETDLDRRADVRLLFTQLVTPGDDNDDLRRRATLEELSAVAPSVIDRYCAHRLLVTDVHPITRQPTIEVAHEALLREWPRLRQWIDDDRDLIRVRRAVGHAAAEWDTQGRDEALLYRGSRLVAAADLAPQATLTTTEREFLAASHTLADRERADAAAHALQQVRQNHRLRRLLVAVAAVLVIAMVAGAVAVHQRNRADNQASAARTAQAAADSEAAAARGAQADAEQANKLATTRGEAAQKASDDALAQKSAAQLAANEALTRSLASQSSSLLATNRNDLALLLGVEAQRFGASIDPSGGAVHEARTALLRALGAEPLLSGYYDGIVGGSSQLTYSPDGKRLLSVSDRGDVVVWDTVTRKQISTAGLHAAGTLGALNDSGLLAVSQLGTPAPVMLWDLATDAPWPWQPTGQPAYDPNSWVWQSVAVSKDGLVARGVGPFSGGSSTVDVWDAVAGVRIGSPIQVPGLVDTLAFSPDGTTLALSVVSADKQALGLELVNARTLTVGPWLVAHPGSTDGAFDHGDQPFRSILIFSPDGRTVSSVVSRSTVGAVATFDTSTGALISHPDVGRDRTVLDVSSDLGYLVLGAGATDSATTQSPVEVIDAATGEVIVDFKVPSAPLLARPVAMNPARHELVFQNGGGALVSLDWSQAGAPSFATADDAQVYGPTVAIDSNGTVVDLSEPVQLLGLGESVTPFRQWKASTDGQVVFITGDTAQIWDPSEHRFVRRLTGVPPSCATTTRMTFVGSAEHGRIILACTPTMVSWNLDAASEAPEWQTDRSDPMDVVVGPTLNHSRSMFVDHDTLFLRLVEAATGRVISRVGRTNDQITAVAFSPDDSMIAALYWSGDIELLDASDLSPIRTLKSRTGSVVDGGVDGGFPAVTITADNTYVAAWHRKLGLEIWDAASGESLAVIDGRRDYRPSAGGDRESTIPIAGFGDAAFPTVTVWSSDDGSVLHTQVVQAFVRADGTGFQRSLGTEWSMNVDDWVKAACGIVGRDLTQQEWETYIGAGVPYHATCTA